MSLRKIAVVTGANKGIGFEIVRGLCKEFTGTVYLTCNLKKTLIFKFCQYIDFILFAARIAEYGHKALEELKKEGLEPKYHQLDIQNSDSIKNFANYLKQNYEGIDILINNAAILIAVYICCLLMCNESKNS